MDGYTSDDASKTKFADKVPVSKGFQTIISNELFRSDVANALGYDGMNKTSQDRMKFLKSIDWNDEKSRDKVTKLYVERVARLTFDRLYNPDEMAPSSSKKNLTLSWGSPATTDDDNRENVKFEDAVIVRPQLRIMVQNDYTPEDRADNPSLPPERYLITFTPPTEEATPSEATVTFMKEMRRTIEQDLGVKLEDTAVHQLTDKPEIGIEGEGEFRLVGRNIYSNTGASMDLFLPTEEAVKGYKDIVSKGIRDIGEAHTPSWLEAVESADKDKSGAIGMAG